MTDDSNKPLNEKTLNEVADEGLPVTGNDRLIHMGPWVQPNSEPPPPPAYPALPTSHPWNRVYPKPPELPPAAPAPGPRYRLLVRHSTTKKTDSDDQVSATAECDSIEQLLDLKAQFTENLGYTFVSLVLIEPPG